MPYCDRAHQLVVEVYVLDLRRSLAFYGRLGFELLRDDGHFAELRFDGHHLFLAQVEALPVEPPAPFANMRLMVPDVDHYAALAAELGATIIRPIADRHYGLRDFTMVDPDGFGLRFATGVDRCQPSALVHRRRNGINAKSWRSAAAAR